MERVTEQRQVAVGFYADIPQAFWRRVTRYHIPVKWFACWLGMAIMQCAGGFMALAVPWQWILGGGIAIALVELMALQWVTWADPEWDTMLARRDCCYYEAE